MRMLQFSGTGRQAAGFTLLEVLLAFVIFALSFAIVLEILGGSMRSSIRAREYTEAALLGQSLMDLVGTEFPLQEGAQTGDSPGGYRWELVISSYVPRHEGDRALELAELAGTQLYWIDLDVSWGQEPRRREVHFSTVRGIVGEPL